MSATAANSTWRSRRVRGSPRSLHRNGGRSPRLLSRFAAAFGADRFCRSESEHDARVRLSELITQHYSASATIFLPFGLHVGATYVALSSDRFVVRAEMQVRERWDSQRTDMRCSRQRAGAPRHGRNRLLSHHADRPTAKHVRAARAGCNRSARRRTRDDAALPLTCHPPRARLVCTGRSILHFTSTTVTAKIAHAALLRLRNRRTAPT